MIETTKRPKILVADDNEHNLVAMRRLLGRLEIDIVEARTGNEALSATLDHDFALALLDVHMPEMDGFEAANLLAQEESTRYLPIIFVTATHADDLNRLRGYGFGAVDYIAKPVNESILLSKVQVFLELYRHRSALRVAAETLRERNRQLEAEIAERRRAEELVRHQAIHDGLTGLPNRLLFEDRVTVAIERCRRDASRFALIYIDIDGFKPINDRHGHLAGDVLLVGVAQRLRQAMRTGDTVARIGGDEFVVILERAPDIAAAARRVESLAASLRTPYSLVLREETIEVSITASFGVALYPDHGGDYDSLLHAADDAMYRAKRHPELGYTIAEGLDDDDAAVTTVT
jgi:diguanylate cyclase (GGDEF)-like protein